MSWVLGRTEHALGKGLLGGIRIRLRSVFVLGGIIAVAVPVAWMVRAVHEPASPRTEPARGSDASPAPDEATRAAEAKRVVPSQAGSDAGESVSPHSLGEASGHVRIEVVPRRDDDEASPLAVRLRVSVSPHARRNRWVVTVCGRESIAGGLTASDVWVALPRAGRFRLRAAVRPGRGGLAGEEYRADTYVRVADSKQLEKQIEELSRVVVDRSGFVEGRALRALIRTRDLRAGPALSRVVREASAEHAAARTNAAMALLDLPDLDSFPLLISLLKEAEFRDNFPFVYALQYNYGLRSCGLLRARGVDVRDAVGAILDEFREVEPQLRRELHQK